jgi:hypothetical protein
MAIKTVAVQVSANTFEVLEALVAVLLAAKTAFDDGFQPSQDLPEITQAAMKNLIPQLGKIKEILPELAESKTASAAALAVVLKNGLSDLLKG